MAGGRLQGKIAVITGGASGIGAATVLLFAQQGAHVFSIDRNPSPPWDVPNIVPIQADVSREVEVQAALRDVVQRAGRVDILDNCAGIGRNGRLHETTSEDWDAVHAVNLRGVYLTCKNVLPEMMRRGSGSVVNISSGIGVTGSRSHHAYSAAKAGVVMLTRSMAVAYAQYGIRANCICPGPIDTPMLDEWLEPRDDDDARREVIASIPLGRLGRPEDIAYAALFLASDEAAFVTGAVLAVDGGALA